MNPQEMRDALRQSQATQQAADDNANMLAEILDNWTLRQLKRELRGYNPHTRTWR